MWLGLLACTVTGMSRLAASDAGAARRTAPLIAYFVLALANPRLAPYDLFPALLCLLMAGTIGSRGDAWPLAILAALLLNLIRPILSNVLRVPAPSWLREPGPMQFAGLIIVFAAWRISIHARPAAHTPQV
jgi:hypothetical protein